MTGVALLGIAEEQRVVVEDARERLFEPKSYVMCMNDARAIPDLEKYTSINDRMSLRHETDRFLDSIQAGVPALGSARVDLAELRVVLPIRPEHASSRAAGVSLGVEVVDQESRVLEEVGLAQHAVRRKRAGKVIDDDARRFLPPCEERRESVVPSLASRNAMPANTYQMRTPNRKDATSEVALSVRLVVLVAADAACTGFTDDGAVSAIVVLEVRIRRT